MPGDRTLPVGHGSVHGASGLLGLVLAPVSSQRSLDQEGDVAEDHLSCPGLPPSWRCAGSPPSGTEGREETRGEKGTGTGLEQ